jgi:hypothetical protein
MRILLQRKQMRMLLDKGLLPKGKSLTMNGNTFNFIMEPPEPIKKPLNADEPLTIYLNQNKNVSHP